LAIDGYVRTNKVDLSDFLPYHVEAAKWGGKQYGLCAFGGFQHPGYNQTMGQAAGIPDPAQEESKGTWTWPRYVEVCTRLTAGQGDQAMAHGTSRGTWQMWVINNGGNVLTEDRTGFALDRPEAVEALQFWVDLVRKHRVAPSDDELRLEGEGARWNTGRLGFFYNVRGGLGSAGVDIRDGFKWNVVPVPRGKTRKAHLNSNGQTFALKATKHPDDAFLLVWGWSGREGQIARLDAGDPLTPSLRSVAFSPAFLNQTVRAQGKPDFPVPPNFNQFWAEQIRQGNVEGIPVHPKLPQILAEINKGLGGAMTGAMGVSEAIAAIKPQVAALLR
jgi:ABC-type glycerol-3-phosphate transport system substrate-binding protein